MAEPEVVRPAEGTRARHQAKRRAAADCGIAPGTSARTLGDSGHGGLQYISALHFGGPPDKFLDLARTGAIQLTISDDILAEVARVLRDKFGWSKEAVSMAQARVADFTLKVAPAQKLDVVREDPADNRILECAVEGKSEYLVTRDNHLLKLKSLGATRMIKVADFLRVARAGGSG